MEVSNEMTEEILHRRELLEVLIGLKVEGLLRDAGILKHRLDRLEELQL